MIYEANTTRWEIGDIVIHDADAKTDRMLMRVVGETDDGRLITRYLDRSVCRDKYENRPDVLHDPYSSGYQYQPTGPTSIDREEMESEEVTTDIQHKFLASRRATSR